MTFFCRRIALLFVCLLALSVRCAQGLDAVMLTVGKDTRVFEKSIVSSLKYLDGVKTFYVITPAAKELDDKLGKELGSRVKWIDEKIFPFDWRNVSDIMIRTVEEKGVYPINGKTQFEHTVYGRVGWFLQQLLKFYAAKILDLGDFVLLDSDIVFFKNITLINSTTPNADGMLRYNYASSSQYHPSYMATLTKISGVDLYKSPDGVYRSGIVHHMVIVRKVLDHLFEQTEKTYGMPFWQVLLNVSALELTCRAPRQGICGGGSTLSEYEMYLNYARQKFPDTVNMRPLMWANGPAPGLQFWPPPDVLQSDGPKSAWLGHRQQEIPVVMVEQMEADALQGFDYVGYHNYAKRRYFELVGHDIDDMCKGVALPVNSTCSWNGFDEKKRKKKEWFNNCACYMANNQAGP